ncbi:MAG TPA: radical SAM protein [Acidobacteriota bacterium]
MATQALRPTGGFLHGYSHSLNPYIGCRFGCSYCYVAALPVALRGAGRPWGDWVQAKPDLPAQLERDLAQLQQRGELESVRVFFGSATDPYQPLERKLEITRRCLAALARRPPGRLVLQTRAPLVERDLGLLRRIPRALVSLTIETDDESVRRTITPRCPPLEARWSAAHALRRAGIELQISAAPLLPHHPDRFAARLAESADRVVVDTLLDGDGAGGRRSAALPIAGQLGARGLDWRDPRPARALLERLRALMGADRVGFSCEGFNRVVLPPSAAGARAPKSASIPPNRRSQPCATS